MRLGHLPEQTWHSASGQPFATAQLLMWPSGVRSCSSTLRFEDEGGPSARLFSRSPSRSRASTSSRRPFSRASLAKIVSLLPVPSPISFASSNTTTSSVSSPFLMTRLLPQTMPPADGPAPVRR